MLNRIKPIRKIFKRKIKNSTEKQQGELFRINRQLSELYRDHDVYITPLPGLSFNDFVQISCGEKGNRKRRIYVWVRFIDEYYMMFYNSITKNRFHKPELLIDRKKNSIVLCKHYRVRLGLSDDKLGEVRLQVKKIRNPLKKIRALYDAPDSMIRTTTVISIISIIMGITAIILGIMSLF